MKNARDFEELVCFDDIRHRDATKVLLHELLCVNQRLDKLAEALSDLQFELNNLKEKQNLNELTINLNKLFYKAKNEQHSIKTN